MQGPNASAKPKVQLLKHNWPDEYSRSMVFHVCCLSAPQDLLNDQRSSRSALKTAINRSDTAALFDWLTNILSYQGISDQVAAGYVRKHGNARWQDIAEKLAAKPSCPKLRSFWHFNGCGYDKTRQTCAEPYHFASCPLPKHRLRNGRLNQTAYSLFLFMRDVAGGDFVGWLQSVLGGPGSAGDRAIAIVRAMRGIFGISDKTLSMALSVILLAAPKRLASWHEIGGSMIVVDTLVHNFLVRTGILKRAAAEHPYGEKCYGAGGCVTILETLAVTIDASTFNPAYPRRFPRFVQNAIWRYCAQSDANICNGNMISDRHACQNRGCRLYKGCDRRPLQPKAPKT